MNGSTTSSVTAEIEAFVGRFEEALMKGGERDLARFLPEPHHPAFQRTLCECIRIDMEYGWEQGQVRRLADYRLQFSDFFKDLENVRAVAFEEYRLRRRAGENPTPEQYAERLGIDTADWPSLSSNPLQVQKKWQDSENGAASARRPDEPPAGFRRAAFELNVPAEEVPTSPILIEAARVYRNLRQRESLKETSQQLEQWRQSAADNASVRFFHDLHQQAPDLAKSVAESLTTMPEVGDIFLDFFLVTELGRGAFGRVFLARQQALANRLVALKVAPDVGGESQTLAQLQHTYIVPIYSFHHAGKFQAVCMPYFGRLTLADITKNLRNRSSLPHSGAALLTTLQQQQTQGAAHPAGEPAPKPDLPQAPEPQRDQASRSILKKMQGLSYVEAVLLWGSFLADGLAHAHERGIQHRDLKPANVLITDEGVPMLLDFNLAEDTKLRNSASAAMMGGTLPYMSPEQIEAFRSGQGEVDARSDIFSLGIILFELLTGHTPWEHRKESRPQQKDGTDRPPLEEVIEWLYQQRLKPAASVRRYNRLASPAVASIIKHCLEPDPGRRYQTARSLQEDLQRQLEAQPLKYAREPSLRERVKKRLSRSPRLFARSAAVVAVCLLGVALWFGLRSHQLQREQEAAINYTEFRQELHPIQFNLTIREDSKRLAAGQQQCRETLERYHVLSDPDWRHRPLFTFLEDEQRQRLEINIGDLLLLLVLAELRTREHLDAPLSPADFAEVLHWNREAERCLSENGPSPVVLHQRADLYERQGKNEQAKQLRDQAAGLPLETPQDCYIHGRSLISKGQVKQALPFLQKAAQLDPQNYWANFLLGLSWEDLGNDREAAACYSICVALDPRFFGGYFNRGLAYLRQKNFSGAAADFDQVISMQPESPEAYINRALAWNGQKQYPKALDDLTQALELGNETRVYFIRARVKKKLGDETGYQQDLAEGLKRQPSDEQSWIARGLARADAEPQAALQDFDQALKLNPASRAAWNNKAYVHAEFLKRYEDSIKCLDQVIKLYPDYAPARAGRGVLFARQGNRELALKDAKAALALDTRPPSLYQVGCIYAQTSKLHPGDRGLALKLVADAVRLGFGANLLAKDNDMDPLRHLPEFKKIQAAAATLAR